MEHSFLPSLGLGLRLARPKFAMLLWRPDFLDFGGLARLRLIWFSKRGRKGNVIYLSGENLYRLRSLLVRKQVPPIASLIAVSTVCGDVTLPRADIASYVNGIVPLS